MYNFQYMVGAGAGAEIGDKGGAKIYNKFWLHNTVRVIYDNIIVLYYYQVAEVTLAKGAKYEPTTTELIQIL